MGCNGFFHSERILLLSQGCFTIRICALIKRCLFRTPHRAFGTIARPGDILVSGFNFGCGSSREQAATSILAKKIPLVVAGSFSNIFSRNSINNGLMGVEMAKLVQRLRETFSNTSPQASQRNIREPSLNRESLDSPPPAPQITPENEKQLTRRT